MLGKYFSFNGKLLPIEKATIPIDNIEFSYGFGVYENFKVRNKFIYFSEQHCERLLHSANIISLPIKLNKAQIKKYLEEFVNNVNQDSFNIKMLLIGNKNNESDLYIFALAPKYLPRKAYTQGVKVITYEGERQFPQAKTLNMLMSYLAYREAKKQNAYDALMIDKENRIIEGTRTNFYFSDGNIFYTPPENCVLNGVTRITLIEALKKQNIRLEEKHIKLNEINDYEGFFLTSTSAKVLPISKIDNKKIDIPEIIKKVIKVYDKYLKDYKKTATHTQS